MNRIARLVTPLVIAVATALIWSSSHALAQTGETISEPVTHTVNVDPVDYTGDWLIDGIWRTGADTIVLEVGTYDMYIGLFQRVSLTLAINGDVVVSNPDAIAVDGRDLTFQTTSVLVDTVDYQGEWHVYGVNRFGDGASGISELTLVKSTRYGLEVGGLSGRFLFDVDAEGKVAIPGGNSATADENTIIFNTVSVVVDPGAYEGSWSIYGVSEYETGAHIVSLVPDIANYAIRPGYGFIYFDIDANGQVISQHPGTIGGNSQLTLNTVPITVEPGRYLGSWGIDEGKARSYLAGPAVIDLPPGMTYVFSAGSWARFSVDIDPFGNVFARNGVSAQGGAGSLSFNTTPILINALQFSGLWAINFVHGWTNESEIVDLVPLGSYALLTNEGKHQMIFVAEVCSDTSTEHDVYDETIYIECGLPDSFDVGIPAVEDSAPQVALLAASIEPVDTDVIPAASVEPVDTDVIPAASVEPVATDVILAADLASNTKKSKKNEKSSKKSKKSKSSKSSKSSKNDKKA